LENISIAIRELYEEMGLSARRSDGIKIYEHQGTKCDHDVYLISATGRLKVDKVT